MHVKAIKMRWAVGGVNYCYLLSSEDKTKSWLIDPAEPLEVLPALSEEEMRSIVAVVNTHHHYDHSGGNVTLTTTLRKRHNNVKVIAGSDASFGVSVVPQHLDVFKLGNLEVVCIRTPCHTQDSICYYVKDSETAQNCLFSGDTLFSGGCGRFFEGSAVDMDVSLNLRLLEGIGERNWPLTKVYPGHEYSKGNAEFIRKFVYKNPGDNTSFDEFEKYCNTHEVTTGHFTVLDELKYNPFMRLEDPKIREAVGDKIGKWSRDKVMEKLRFMKNTM
ncbi:hypothetical protein Kpol_526p43 [Vanderwaltozyma polyspora DSM 70294]|uniref:hydroxyacylglutathione hydrolase n=1 Tax=Vanderwaltozyma polyspora (strain ATCC 22028 / DSM 70294 / BCRC 21397 / CBS 2163 / NBRC 10782 / NRRL Y-8283 / UCD 57-17) TaxID=436907 RepID=A7TLU8_VANPO|nr:uncharacterized protein Kpol_526p43 [Vanderwaltozyma polyspora DSM 70294]EDO16790.1 hypothetical protein Kpol_526p43 [Vanderwaltozyma polyspora DSM 70294]